MTRVVKKVPLFVVISVWIHNIIIYSAFLRDHVTTRATRLHNMKFNILFTVNIRVADDILF